MKIIYDRQSDTLTVLLGSQPVAESDELREDLILDYDAAGHIVALELLGASRFVAEPHTFAYEVKPAS